MVSYRSTKLLTSLIRTTTSNAVLPRTSLLSITSNRINSSRPIISNNLNNFSLNKKNFSSSSVQSHGGKGRPKPGEGIILHFKKSTGEAIETVECNEGDDIVDVSWEYDLDIEAACEKSIACSTCHVILDEAVYDQLEEPSDDENDMLDLAFGLTDTSRLGCQVKVTKAMHNSTITLPSATRNLRVDGSKPTPH